MFSLKAFALRYGLIAITAVAAIAAIGFYSARPQLIAVTDSAANQPTAQTRNPPVSTSSDPTTSPEAPSSPVADGKGKHVLVRIVGDIQVEVTSAKIVDTGVEIGVCYATPDSGDWYPMFSHLFFNTREIYPDEFDFLTEDSADGSKYGRRCVAVRYKIAKMDTITTPILFGVEELYAVQREGNPCESFQDRLDTSPKARAYGLKVKCTEFDNGTQFSVELIEHGEMVDQGAAKLALDEIIQGTVTGPWQFTITEIQK